MQKYGDFKKYYSNVSNGNYNYERIANYFTLKLNSKNKEEPFKVYLD
jgi:hypothetical protein